MLGGAYPPFLSTDFILKILLGNNPSAALRQIYSLSLYDSIFAPLTETLPPLQTQHIPRAVSALTYILSLSARSQFPHVSGLLLNNYDVYLAWLFAALTPWELHMFPGVGARKPIPGAAVAAREGIKAPNKVFDTLVKSYNNLATIRTVTQAVAGGQMWARNTAGMFVRGLGPDWRNQVLCCVLLDLAKTWKDDETEPCMYYSPPYLHMADLSPSSPAVRGAVERV